MAKPVMRRHSPPPRTAAQAPGYYPDRDPWPAGTGQGPASYFQGREYPAESYPRPEYDGEYDGRGEHDDAPGYPGRGHDDGPGYQADGAVRTRTAPPPTRAPRSVPEERGADGEKHGASRNAVDAWMGRTFKFGGSSITRKAVALFLLGVPGLAPMFFMSRAVIELNNNTMNQVNADVMGTGSMTLLILTLTITPLAVLYKQRWFVPLRRWYGIVLAVNATTDATIASITSGFHGGVIGRLTGHTFLLIGAVMVSLLIPLMIMANPTSQRWLGKYWKQLQRLTYAVWALLFIHLALLEGLGFQHGTNGPSSSVDGDPILHQRLYQLTACSLPLLLVRLPPIHRWIVQKQREGKQRTVALTFLPLWILYAVFFTFIINEEIFKGVSAFRLQPVNG